MSETDYVYLDWAATTPLCCEAADAMAPYLQGGIDNIMYSANTNSLHTPGRHAFESLETSRRTFLRCINAHRPQEIIFTSGATESDNAAIDGLAYGALLDRRNKGEELSSPQIIVSAIEHKAVMLPALKLAKEGFRVTLVHPDKSGCIQPKAVEELIDDQTVLVSIMTAHNEMGRIQPLSEIAPIVHRAGALFHSDAAQALGKIPIDVRKFDVDAMSFSSHKLLGPKGMGALYLRANTPFSPYLLGGGQENDRRSGTHDVAGIVGFATATKTACDMLDNESARLRGLRDFLYEQLAKIDGVVPTIAVPKDSTDYLPNIVHVLVEGFESETLVLRLDELGFAVSGGAACSTNSSGPSTLVDVLRLSQPKKQYCTIRASFGRYTTKEDIDSFIQAFKKVLTW